MIHKDCRVVHNKYLNFLYAVIVDILKAEKKLSTAHFYTQPHDNRGMVSGCHLCVCLPTSIHSYVISK